MAEENKLIMGSMAEMLGVPLFTTDLYIPRYRAGEIGNWKIVNSTNVLAPGYFKGLQMVENLSALLKKRRNGQEGWDTWMSITPSELESQELGCRYAFGHTVIMGLGMGWIAINAGIEKRQGKNVTIDAAAIKQCIAEDIGLPLLIPSDINYAGLIENVAKNRKGRNLSMGRMLKP